MYLQSLKEHKVIPWGGAVVGIKSMIGTSARNIGNVRIACGLFLLLEFAVCTKFGCRMDEVIKTVQIVHTNLQIHV